MSGFVTGLWNRDQHHVPLFTGFMAEAARAIRDPRIAGVLRAGPRVVDFLVRSHRRTAGIADDDSIVKVRPTPALAAQAYLDEVLIAALRHPDLLPKEEDYVPAAADLAIAREVFAVRGGSTTRRPTTATPRRPTTYGRSTRPPTGWATSTPPSRAGGSRIPRSPAGRGGSSTRPTGRRTSGCRGPQAGTTGPGWSASTGSAWGSTPRSTCARFARPSCTGWAYTWR